MAKVLITAFEPYAEYDANASWLALMELTRELPDAPRVVTRLYPVDFDGLRRNLSRDLAQDFDVALHLGQAPGQARLHLEAIGVNVRGHSGEQAGGYAPLIPDGPVAYRSNLPLADWCSQLRAAGIPAQVSYHAGTFLCNATLYTTHYLAEREGLRTQATFLHLPLESRQVLGSQRDLPHLAAGIAAGAVRLILAQIEQRARQPAAG